MPLKLQATIGPTYGDVRPILRVNSKQTNTPLARRSAHDLYTYTYKHRARKSNNLSIIQ